MERWASSSRISTAPVCLATDLNGLKELKLKELVTEADDARAAVRICKYPPVGCRSMTGQQPALNMKGSNTIPSMSRH